MRASPFLIPLLATGLLASAFARTETPGLPTLSAMLETYGKACGGEALEAVRTLGRRGTLVRGAQGKVPFTALWQAPGYWSYDQIFAYGDGASYGFDGKGGWVNDARGTRPLPAAERLDLQLVFDIRAPLRLRELFPGMKVKGMGRCGEAEAVVVQARSREGFETELRFDRKSGLLLQAGELRFEDYRSEGRLTLPHRILFGAPSADGLDLKLEIAEVRIDEPVDPSAFVPPSCRLAPRPAPLYTLRKQVTVPVAALEACLGVYRHPADPKVRYTVSLQEGHLMLEKTGWGRRLEIKPESELDYFVRFLNLEFHFVRNAAGEIAAVEIGNDRKIRAERIPAPQ